MSDKRYIDEISPKIEILGSNYKNKVNSIGNLIGFATN
jgi:hypothetical protein